MNFKEKKILIIGDSILDETIVGEAVGVSLESPTLKIRESKRSVSFGGAANVVENLLALGATVTYITVLGKDEYTHYFDQLSLHSNLCFSPLMMDRVNNVKTRIWCTKGEERYKSLQVNRTDTSEFTSRIPTINHHLQNVDTVILVDYGLGVFGEVDYIIEAAHASKIPVIASSQMSDRDNRYSLFANADYLCMNQEEAAAYGKVFRGCITQGKKGCVFWDDWGGRGWPRGEWVGLTHPGYEVDCVDACGAGDAFLAALSLFINDVDLEALSFCNRWAACSTTRLGTTPPTIGEVDELLRSSVC